ncbi:MAG: RNA polymerase sigma-54 factor, partial [Treponema sp.]|nr:RNA polymerase sigma-54 factor [Treponema sp.]
MQLQRPSLIQTQKFMMNPQFYQSIKLMELPIMDLREKIEEELERNPALEVLEDHTTVSLEASTVPHKEEEEYFEGASDLGFVSRAGEAAADEQRRFIEGVPAHSETLQEHLLWQLRLEPVDGDIRRIGELLIQNLNQDGFHKEPVDVLLKNENPEIVQKAVKLVQGLDPAGTCTADFRESLRVQIELLPDAPRGILEALSYLELLERGKTADAARQMGYTEEETGYIFKRI